MSLMLHIINPYLISSNKKFHSHEACVRIVGQNASECIFIRPSLEPISRAKRMIYKKYALISDRYDGFMDRADCHDVKVKRRLRGG